MNEKQIQVMEAADYIAREMIGRRNFADHLPGCLLVVYSNFDKFLIHHLDGTCSEDTIQAASYRAKVVYEQRNAKGEIPDATTSSDAEPFLAGAVSADKNLILSYASQKRQVDGIVPHFEEAVAIMMALKSGLLQSEDVVDRFSDLRSPKFNPHLRRLHRNITWPK